MTLEEHPSHSLLFRQGTPGDSFYVVFSGEVGLYFEPGSPEDAASAMISAMIRGRITRRAMDLELAARRLVAAAGTQGTEEAEAAEAAKVAAEAAKVAEAAESTGPTLRRLRRTHDVQGSAIQSVLEQVQRQFSSRPSTPEQAAAIGRHPPPAPTSGTGTGALTSRASSPAQRRRRPSLLQAPSREMRRRSFQMASSSGPAPSLLDTVTSRVKRSVPLHDRYMTAT